MPEPFLFLAECWTAVLVNYVWSDLYWDILLDYFLVIIIFCYMYHPTQVDWAQQQQNTS